MRHAIVVENAGPNFSALVPNPPGCVATGAALEEVEREIRGAIEFHLDGLREDGSPVPPPLSAIRYIDIATLPALNRMPAGVAGFGERFVGAGYLDRCGFWDGPPLLTHKRDSVP